MKKAENVHLWCMQIQSPSIPLTLRDSDNLVTLANGHLRGNTSLSETTSQVAMLTMILALLPYVYKRSVRSWQKPNVQKT